MNDVETFLLQIANELQESMDDDYQGITNSALQLAANVLRGFLLLPQDQQAEINLLGLGVGSKLAAKLGEDIRLQLIPKNLASQPVSQN